MIVYCNIVKGLLRQASRVPCIRQGYGRQARNDALDGHATPSDCFATLAMTPSGLLCHSNSLAQQFLAMTTSNHQINLSIQGLFYLPGQASFFLILP